MLARIMSVWFWFGSDRSGFCLGTCLWITLPLLMYAGGIQAGLGVGPGGDFPTFTDVCLYAVGHDELTSLLLFGPCQERRWGTVARLVLSVLTLAILPFLYAVVLFAGEGEASRICGFSAIQLALFVARCRQVTQRRLLRCLPVWFLPWFLLPIGLLLLLDPCPASLLCNMHRTQLWHQVTQWMVSTDSICKRYIQPLTQTLEFIQQ